MTMERLLPIYWQWNAIDTLGCHLNCIAMCASWEKGLTPRSLQT